MLNLQMKILLVWFCLTQFGPVKIDCALSGYYHRFGRRCMTVFPTRSQLFQSNNIVLVGLVEQIKPLDLDEDPKDSNRQMSNYLANVLVRRVLYGPRSLNKNQIQVTGFNPPQADESHEGWCHPNTRQGDTWIFVLQPINFPEYFRLNSSLIRITLANLEKFDAIIADRPYGLRSNFPELPCEKKYCENNANCINDPYSAEGARCECLTHCKTSKYEPVCGSNDETYNNECELRLQSCRSKKNIFMKGPTSCYYLKPIHGNPISYLPIHVENNANSFSNRNNINPNQHYGQYSSSSLSSYSSSSAYPSSTYHNSNRHSYSMPPVETNPTDNHLNSRTYQSTSTTINRSYLY